jgi:hypothetical protein
MSKIPTAEKFQRNYSIEYYDEGGYQGIEEKEVSKMLIEFTKLHVEAALKQASEKAILDSTYIDHIGEFEDIPLYDYFVVKESILDAYPLENIK